MSDDDNQSSVKQDPPVDYLGIGDDEWWWGVTLERWARRRDEDAYDVASRNPLFIISEDPYLATQYFGRNDSPDDKMKHVEVRRRLRDLLLDDLKNRRCVLGVPPQSAVESASRVSLDALDTVIKNINWGISPPVSSLSKNPVQGKLVNLRLYRPDRFGETPGRRERGGKSTSTAGTQSTDEYGEPKAETIARRKEDYEKVENQMKIHSCGPRMAAGKAHIPGRRSADAIYRGHYRHKEWLEWQNGKLPQK